MSVTPIRERVPVWLDQDRRGRLGPVRVPERMEALLTARAKLHGRSVSSELRLAVGTWLESPRDGGA